MAIPAPRARHPRCTLCGAVLPGWRPIPQAPESALLRHHLGVWHLAEAKPQPRRMETECIDEGGMELFERVDAP